jgi:hypothetical protein
MSGSRGQWEDYAEQLRQRLPEPPPGLQDAYVKWIPWLAIIFGAIGLIFMLLFAVLGAVVSPFLVLAGAEGMRAGMEGVFAIALGIIESALGLAGGLLMLRMRATGWWIYAVGLIIGVVSNLASFSIIGLAITLAIAWVHVHVRPRYT